MSAVSVLAALKEVLQYSVPSSPETQLYDFYVLSYCNTLPSDPRQTDAMGRPAASFIARTGVKDDIDYAFAQLLPVLREELLNSVFFSMCAEIRHFGQRTQDPSVVADLPGRSKKVLKKYLELQSRSDTIKKLFPRRPEPIKVGDNVLAKTAGGQLDATVKEILPDGQVVVEYPVEEPGRAGTATDTIPASAVSKVPDPNQGQSVEYDKSYRNALRAIRQTDMAKADFVAAMEPCFRNGSWSSQYGGRAWGDIAAGWLHLWTAKTIPEMATYIDHVYDLQHNTGTVFNKVKRYSQGGSFDWIKRALDQKASVTNIEKIFPKASTYARKIGYAALKMAGRKAPVEAPPPAPEEIKVGDTVQDKSGSHGIVLVHGGKGQYSDQSQVDWGNGLWSWVSDSSLKIVKSVPLPKVGAEVSIQGHIPATEKGIFQGIEHGLALIQFPGDSSPVLVNPSKIEVSFGTQAQPAFPTGSVKTAATTWNAIQPGDEIVLNTDIETVLPSYKPWIGTAAKVKSVHGAYATLITDPNSKIPVSVMTKVDPKAIPQPGDQVIIKAAYKGAAGKIGTILDDDTVQDTVQDFEWMVKINGKSIVVHQNNLSVLAYSEGQKLARETPSATNAAGFKFYKGTNVCFLKSPQSAHSGQMGTITAVLGTDSVRVELYKGGIKGEEVTAQASHLVPIVPYAKPKVGDAVVVIKGSMGGIQMGGIKGKVASLVNGVVRVIPDGSVAGFDIYPDRLRVVGDFSDIQAHAQHVIDKNSFAVGDQVVSTAGKRGWVTDIKDSKVSMVLYKGSQKEEPIINTGLVKVDWTLHPKVGHKVISTSPHTKTGHIGVVKKYDAEKLRYTVKFDDGGTGTGMTAEDLMVLTDQGQLTPSDFRLLKKLAEPDPQEFSKGDLVVVVGGPWIDMLGNVGKVEATEEGMNTHGPEEVLVSFQGHQKERLEGVDKKNLVKITADKPRLHHKVILTNPEHLGDIAEVVATYQNGDVHVAFSNDMQGQKAKIEAGYAKVLADQKTPLGHPDAVKKVLGEPEVGDTVKCIDPKSALSGEQGTVTQVVLTSHGSTYVVDYPTHEAYFKIGQIELVKKGEKKTTAASPTQGAIKLKQGDKVLVSASASSKALHGRLVTVIKPFAGSYSEGDLVEVQVDRGEIAYVKTSALWKPTNQATHPTKGDHVMVTGSRSVKPWQGQTGVVQATNVSGKCQVFWHGWGSHNHQWIDVSELVPVVSVVPQDLSPGQDKTTPGQDKTSGGGFQVGDTIIANSHWPHMRQMGCTGIITQVDNSSKFQHVWVQFDDGKQISPAGAISSELVTKYLAQPWPSGEPQIGDKVIVAKGPHAYLTKAFIGKTGTIADRTLGHDSQYRVVFDTPAPNQDYAWLYAASIRPIAFGSKQRANYVDSSKPKGGTLKKKRMTRRELIAVFMKSRKGRLMQFRNTVYLSPGEIKGADTKEKGVILGVRSQHSFGVWTHLDPGEFSDAWLDAPAPPRAVAWVEKLIG